MNNRGQAVKKNKKIGERKPEISPQENALIFNWLEFRCKELFGCGNSSSVVVHRKEAWDLLTDEVDKVHNGRFQRTKVEVEKRINNG